MIVKTNLLPDNSTLKLVEIIFNYTDSYQGTIIDKMKI